MDVLLGFLVLVGVPFGYAALQVVVLRRWRGVFRLAAVLPLLGWAAWAARFAVDVTRDPTSHNLFPFKILLGARAALAYLGLLAGLHWLFPPSRAGPAPRS